MDAFEDFDDYEDDKWDWIFYIFCYILNIYSILLVKIEVLLNILCCGKLINHLNVIATRRCHIIQLLFIHLPIEMQIKLRLFLMRNLILLLQHLLLLLLHLLNINRRRSSLFVMSSHHFLRLLLLLLLTLTLTLTLLLWTLFRKTILAIAFQLQFWHTFISNKNMSNSDCTAGNG